MVAENLWLCVKCDGVSASLLTKAVSPPLCPVVCILSQLVRDDASGEIVTITVVVVACCFVLLTVLRSEDEEAKQNTVISM